jgi:hypothetical protein
MVVDEIANRADVVRQLFRERERLAHQATATLAQRVVEPLDMAGLTTLLADCPIGRYAAFAAKVGWIASELLADPGTKPDHF